MHMQLLLQQTAEVLLHPANTKDAAASSQGMAIMSEPQRLKHPATSDEQLRHCIEGLLRWQSNIESLDPAVLGSACWQEVFAYALLMGALRAYSYTYTKVGLV